MPRYFVFYLLVSASFILNQFSFATANEELKYPEIGVLSSKELDHVKAWNNTRGLNGWRGLVNRSGYLCKTYIQSIPLKKLSKLLIFTKNELVPINEKSQAQYGKDSIYFESCNYLTLGPSVGQKFFDVLDGKLGGWEKPKLLEWGSSDAYIDSEYSLLLIKYLDSGSMIPFDEQKASVLFIRKDFQFESNREEDAGVLGNLIGSKGFVELLGMFF